MLHTRLRPHCKAFLEKIAKLFELHVFTFGSRLYAHTIAGKCLNVFLTILKLLKECLSAFGSRPYVGLSRIQMGIVSNV